MLHISPSKCFTKLFFLTPYKHPKELEATKTHILGGCCKKTLCRRHTPVISLAEQSNMAGPKSTESNKNLAHLKDSFISRPKLNQITPNRSRNVPKKLYFSILYSKIIIQHFILSKFAQSYRISPPISFARSKSTV